MRRLALSTVVLLVITQTFAVFADDASFSCKQARTQVEQRICNSPYATLKQLDRDLAKWYKRALSGVADPESLRASQREWLQSLNACVTEDSVEPTKYACNSVLEAEKKAQCFRDFCLVTKYIDRSKFLYALRTQGRPGRYVLSDRWPSGIHENFEFMAAKDRKFCRNMEDTLSAHGPFSSPISKKEPLSAISTRTRVSWISVEKNQLLPTAKRLERVLRPKSQPDTALVESDGFSRQLENRIATGEIEIALSSAPAVVTQRAAGKSEVVSVLRYQRWSDSTKTTDYDKDQQIEFFRVDKGDLSTAQPIGSASDAFVVNGKIYFDSISKRGFDDLWQPLPIPQPELYVYTAHRYESDATTLRTIGHFVYTQE